MAGRVRRRWAKKNNPKNNGHSYGQEQTTCPICFESTLMDEMPMMTCCNRATSCTGCVQQAIGISLKEHMGDVPVPRCLNCNQSMSDADIRKVASPAQLRRYDGIIVGLALHNQPGYHSCPISDCVGLGWLPPGEYGKVSCPSCKHSWVIERQPGMIERAFLGTFDKFGITNLRAEMWKSHHTKPCPSCGVRILKNGGCPHVTCRNVTRGAHCNHEFCWYCLLPWHIHTPVFCLFWLGRYIAFWLCMMIVAWDLPLEFQLSVAGLIYATVRRINSTWRTTILDTTSDSAEAALANYKIGRFVVWFVAACTFLLFTSFPYFFRTVIYYSFSVVIPLAIMIGLLAIFRFHPVIDLIAVVVWWFRATVRWLFLVLLLVPVTIVLPLLPMMLIPIGLIANITAAILSPRSIIYTGNLLSNGISCLRATFIYALLQPITDRGVICNAYLSGVTHVLTIIADLLSLLTEHLVKVSAVFENPLYVGTAAISIILLILTIYSWLTEFSGTSRRVQAISYLLFSSALLGLFFYAEIPFTEPTSLSLYYRNVLTSTWNQFVYKTHPILVEHQWY